MRFEIFLLLQICILASCLDNRNLDKDGKEFKGIITRKEKEIGLLSGKLQWEDFKNEDSSFCLDNCWDCCCDYSSSREIPCPTCGCYECLDCCYDYLWDCDVCPPNPPCPPNNNTCQNQTGNDYTNNGSGVIAVNNGGNQNITIVQNNYQCCNTTNGNGSCCQNCKTLLSISDTLKLVPPAEQTLVYINNNGSLVYLIRGVVSTGTVNQAATLYNNVNGVLSVRQQFSGGNVISSGAASEDFTVLSLVTESPNGNPRSLIATTSTLQPNGAYGGTLFFVYSDLYLSGSSNGGVLSFDNRYIAFSYINGPPNPNTGNNPGVLRIFDNFARVDLQPIQTGGFVNAIQWIPLCQRFENGTIRNRTFVAFGSSAISAPTQTSAFNLRCPTQFFIYEVVNQQTILITQMMTPQFVTTIGFKRQNCTCLTEIFIALGFRRADLPGRDSLFSNVQPSCNGEPGGLRIYCFNGSGLRLIANQTSNVDVTSISFSDRGQMAVVERSLPQFTNVLTLYNLTFGSGSPQNNLPSNSTCCNRQIAGCDNCPNNICLQVASSPQFVPQGTFTSPFSATNDYLVVSGASDCTFVDLILYRLNNTCCSK